LFLNESRSSQRVGSIELTTLSLAEEEAMRLAAIFMGKDKEEALRFLLEVIKPKIRAKGSRALDSKKGIGIPT